MTPPLPPIVVSCLDPPPADPRAAHPESTRPATDLKDLR
jgi:hypothetical protein